MILGQALYGWPDDFPATQFRTASGRAEALCITRARNAARADRLDWIATHPVRTSPFWSVSRMVAEALQPDSRAPWYARFAWVNLYPAAPGGPSAAARAARRAGGDAWHSPIVDGPWNGARVRASPST